MLFSVWKLLFHLHVVSGFISLVPCRQKRSLSQVLDKDRCYCEKPLHFLSVDDLVFYYGDRENWWGDLNAHNTRLLYHNLLPVYYPYYIMPDHTIEIVAFNSYQTRKAVKQYARMRSRAHVRFFSCFFDVLHNLWKYKKWMPKGPTYDDLWQKYEQQFREEDPDVHPDILTHKTATLIAYKSCRTNQRIDKFVFERSCM